MRIGIIGAGNIGGALADESPERPSELRAR